MLQEHSLMYEVNIYIIQAISTYIKTSIFSYSRVVKGVGEIDSARPPQAPSKVEQFSCPYLLLDIRDTESFEDCHIITGQWTFLSTVYRVIFAPVLFALSFYTCKLLHPVVNVCRHSVLKKRSIIWDISVCPVLYSPTDKEGKRCENKIWGKYFSVYVIVFLVCVKVIILLYWQ